MSTINNTPPAKPVNVTKVPVASEPSAPPAEKPDPAAVTPPKDAFTSSPMTYEVKRGDTLGKIAKQTGIPYQTLLELNPHLTETKPGGLKRTAGGDLIYTGELITLRSAPKDYGKLKDKVAAAAEELKKKEAEKELLKAEQERLKAEQALFKAKHVITDMPKPQAWRSADEAKERLEQAEAALAAIPADDPDYPKLAQAVEDLRTGHQAILATVNDVATGKPKLAKERDDFGREVEVKVPRELDDETRKLGAEHVALATPEQKARLIKNLYSGFTSHKEQVKILDILTDAKRQGQLETTLDAVSKMKSGLFSMNVLYNLPNTLNGDNLDKFAEIVKGTANAKLTKAIESAIARRDEQNDPYRN